MDAASAARALLVLVSSAPVAPVAPVAADPRSADRVQLRLDATEADAVLAILARRADGAEPRPADWERLTTSTPYRRLAARERSLGRPFDDETFRAFALSPALAARRAALARTLAAWKRADLSAAAERALRYLPDEARIRATVYPVIKPRDNSFVFEPAGDAAIFLYLDPEVTRDEFENTVAHELHHVGYASLAPPGDGAASESPEREAAITWAGALGEGLAVLAAAGSPDVHPLAAYDAADRARWDEGMRHYPQAFAQLDQFLLDVVRGGFCRRETIDHVAMTFFGDRGPWYLVGYRVGVEIERALGREALLACMRRPATLLARYNEAMRRAPAASGEPLPRWSDELVRALDGTGSCARPGE